MKKFATATIIDARMGDASMSKGAHRAVFNYVPKPGYLYVRSRAISSRCNDNFDMFPAEEIEKSYLSFIGKPVFVNHHNEDHRRARGVIIDAALHRDRNPDGSPDTWVEVLHEVDAIKFPKLAKAILAKEVNRTSMGCDVEFSKCSVCDNVATSPLEYCAHIPGKKGKRIAKFLPDGKREARLVFEICSGLSFFENSLLVEQPADPTAFFLGEVEYGPGLESLGASVRKTANKEQADRYLQTHDPASYKKEYNKGWNRSRNVGDLDVDGISQPFEHGYYDHATDMEKWHSVHCNDPGYHYDCPVARSFSKAEEPDLRGLGLKESSWQKTASVRPSSYTSPAWNLIKEAIQEENQMDETSRIWELIKRAGLIDDDLEEIDAWSFTSAKAPGVPQNNAERHQLLDEKTGNGKGVRNLLDLVHKAASNDHELHSGMKWYDDAHGIAKTISEHHRQQEGHIFHGLSSEEALHRTAGTIGVYSSSSAPAPNLHMAMDAIHHGQAVYSKPVRDESGRTVGNSGFNPEGEGHEHDRHGLPMADDKAAAKINGMLHGGKSIDESWKGGSAHKTHNFSHLIANPNSVDEKGRDRVVVDRHAIAAVIGHKGSSGEVYDNPNGPQFSSLLTSQSGYHKVADMYRQAADHINSSDEFKPLRTKLQKAGLLQPGERVRGHHVQALTWVQQKKISGSRTTTKDQQEIDRFQGSYTHRYGGNGHRPTNWQGFVGGDERHDKTAMLMRLAYGETKAPQDVDTLRAENCTVCGNSTAFDGVQCQVCGYVAPPRPFGDPDTDTAKTNDMRKQVLDSENGTADPSDPDQQLGNQIGNPDELEDQAGEAQDAGQSPMLSCLNCGTGIAPAPAQSAGGEPPYPAEGDVCPVCKKGELAAEGADEADEDMDEDGVPDEDEDESDDDSGNPFAKSKPGEEPDDDEDEEDPDDEDMEKGKK